MRTFLLVLLGGAAAAAVAYFYYLGAALAVTGFLVPVSVVALPSTGLLGALTATGVVAASLLNARTFAEVTATPDDIADGVRPLGLRNRRPDRAWPHYLALQFWLDGRPVLRRFDIVRQSVTTLSAWIREIAGEDYRITLGVVLVAWPLLAVAAGVLLAFLIGLGCGILVVFTLSATLWALASLLWSAVAGATHTADRFTRKLLRANPPCPHCHRHSRPGFRCSGPRCGQVHWDLRPGPLGVWFRRCGCGELLPTTVFRAARRLSGVCPACRRPLRPGSHAVPEIRLPVVGAQSAGKTRLTYAGLLALGDRTRLHSSEFSLVDEESKRIFEEGSRIIRSGEDTPKSSVDRLPAAVTVRISGSRWARRHGRGKALLHLYDVAGEFYEDWQQNEQLEFLDHATGIVFVLDPFTIPPVHAQAAAQENTLLEKARPARQGTMESYEATIQRLRKFRIPTEQLPLAVAVVKADLVEVLPEAADLRPGHAAVRAWVHRIGLDHFVTAAERDFGAVRFFLVSSAQGWTADHPQSAAAPLTWLIERGRVTLPGGPDPDDRAT
ncbi:hypothetical protein [Amycolatopsis sp. GM8]|uniref:TRAFAC clade GTPase domain-containing protein n=1 Tax=Amycolatopsis sp. GM8 TaxID=2896530 RepID=UPI001F1DFBC3|nr:hypothetical protein [Amycolatopsis sp. GM8]